MGHNYDLEKVRRQQIITNRIYEEKYNRVYTKFGGHNYDPISNFYHLRASTPSIATTTTLTSTTTTTTTTSTS